MSTANDQRDLGAPSDPSSVKRRRAAGGQSFSAVEWLALLAHHNGSCAYCGSKVLIEIDHRIPLLKESYALGLLDCQRLRLRRKDR